MSLHYKTLIILAITWMVIMAMIFIASDTIVEGGFYKLEKQYAERNVTRLKEAIEEKAAYVDRHNKDIVRWEKTAEVLIDKNINLFKTQFSKNALSDNQISLYSFWDPNANLVAGYNYDFTLKRFSPIPNDFLRLVASKKIFSASARKSHKGIIKLNNSYWIVSIQKVFGNNKKLLGYSILGSHLTDLQLSAISDVTKLNFQLINFKKAQELRYLTQPINFMSQNSAAYIESSTADITHGYTILNNIFGENVAIMKVELIRDIVQQGKHTTYILLFILLAIATLTGCLVWFLLNKFVLHRLEDMSNQLSSFNLDDADNYSIKLDGDDELNQMAKSINSLLDVVKNYNSKLESRVKERTSDLMEANKNLREEINQRSLIEDELRGKEQELQDLVQYDPLTALPNKVYLDKKLSEELVLMKENEKNLALFSLDVDRFKAINDSLGHKFSDLLLQKIADRMKGLLRNNDKIVRIESDEFVMFSRDIKGKYEIEQITTRILHNLSTPFVVDNREVHISMSIGISLYPENATCPEDLINCSNLAMLKAKDKGGNQFQYYTEILNEEVNKKLDIETKLRCAIQNNDLELHFQPIFDINSKRIRAVEALCRLEDPELGHIPPDEFIRVAEETGLIYQLGNWVLREACHAQKKWIRQGYAPVVMSVNISSSQFRETTFVAQVLNIIETTGISPHQLELEFKESVILENIESAHEKFHQLKKKGVLLVLDDFGTGYTRLDQIKNYCNTLKIDKSLLSELNTTPSIIDALISLGHNLGMSVSIEGVETRQQMDVLVEKNADYLQGHLFSVALSEANLLRHLIYNDEQEQLPPSDLWPPNDDKEGITTITKKDQPDQNNIEH